ncbi:MAG: HEPN domain-containing protein [Candidatus Latescibacter sp.]|nr:HEPN domain-containing protein [Candidatus Latescibacter sp.]
MESQRLLEIIRQWLIKADHDLEIVEREMRFSDEPLTDILCFHCQQAVEKYLKTYLIFKLVKPSKTHDIAELIEECRKLDPDFEKLSDLSYMTEYAVQLRYPDDFYQPELAEMNKAFSDALKAKRFVLEKINVKMR